MFARLLVFLVLVLLLAMVPVMFSMAARSDLDAACCASVPPALLDEDPE